MRTSIRYASALVVLGLVLAGCGDDETATDTSTDGAAATGDPLKICSDIPYEPMEFGDGTEDTPSGYTGFDIDLVQAIADDAGRTLEVAVTPFDGIFGAMNAKKCDAVVSSVTITDDRKKEMAFSAPYFDSNQSLMVLKDDAGTYKELADLAGKNIGVQTGTTGEEYANSNLPDGATVTSLGGAADLFAALESKKIDAIVQDFPINAYRATKNDQVVVQEEIVTDEKYGMAVRLDDADTLKLLDDGLTTAKSDGTYDKIFEKYFGSKP